MKSETKYLTVAKFQWTDAIGTKSRPCPDSMILVSVLDSQPEGVLFVFRRLWQAEDKRELVPGQELIRTFRGRRYVQTCLKLSNASALHMAISIEGLNNEGIIPDPKP